MAQTLDDLVREALGSQLMSILQLQAQNEALVEQVKALTPKPEGPPPAEGGA